MRLVTATEMREVDQRAISEYEVPGMIMMENAGLSIVQTIMEYCWDHRSEGKRVLIVTGPGNNGGDGLVVARHLYNRGALVELWLTSPPEAYRGDAAENLKIITAMGIPYHLFNGDRMPLFQESVSRAELIIDALFGTGFRGTPGEPLAGLIQVINESQRQVLAVDLPSGMEADSGRVAGACIRAQLTVTMGMPKIGLYLEPGASYSGQVVVGDISLPLELRRQDEGNYYLIDRKMVAGLLPRRNSEDHKGKYGHLLVIGGSRGYTGAVCLACNGALRSGAGLVTAMVPATLYPIAATKLTEVMTSAAPDLNGGRAFASTTFSELSELFVSATVVAVGPGLGQAPETAFFLEQLLRGYSRPVVLDADALNILATKKELLNDPLLQEQRQRWVLTPHPGEMARLLGVSTAEIQNDRVACAAKASREWGTTVVLKGARTVVAAPGGEILINPTGNPGLATGGTGDVLTGVIAGLLAQGILPLQAAVAGVFIHGLTADRLAGRRGMAGLIAGDLLDQLPYVLQELEQLAENGVTSL